MKRRRIWLNVLVALALVAVVTVTVISVTLSRGATPAAAATTLVRRGTVTSTVTATGNVESGTTVDVSLAGSAGTVRRIYVHEGQQVVKGAKLLRIDDGAAKRSLRTAEADLKSARADFDTAVQSPSTQDQAVDDASVRSAQTALTNAKKVLAQARATYAQDKKQQAQLVDRASGALKGARSQRDQDAAALDSAKADLKTAQQTGDAAAIASATAAVSSLQSALSGDETAVDTASANLSSARQTRDKTWLADRQSIENESGAVDTACDALASARATRSSNEQPARSGAVQTAQAKVDSAKVGVAEAEQTLADTVLRAPTDGQVTSIAAVVGQPSGSGTATAGGASTSGTSASGSSTSSSTSSTSASSGLVTLVNSKALQVAAQVTEADIGKVEVGQQVSVLFPASGEAASGTVRTVAAESNVVDNVVQYEVDVALPAKTSVARLGQTSTLTIVTAEHADVLYLPTSALTTDAGRTTVTRRVGSTDSVVEVEPGVVGANGTEIVRGLAEGDEVVLPTGAGSGVTLPAAASTSATASPSASATDEGTR